MGAMNHRNLRGDIRDELMFPRADVRLLPSNLELLRLKLAGTRGVGVARARARHADAGLGDVAAPPPAKPTFISHGGGS